MAINEWLQFSKEKVNHRRPHLPAAPFEVQWHCQRYALWQRSYHVSMRLGRLHWLSPTFFTRDLAVTQGCFDVVRPA